MSEHWEIQYRATEWSIICEILATVVLQVHFLWSVGMDVETMPLFSTEFNHYMCLVPIWPMRNFPDVTFQLLTKSHSIESVLYFHSVMFSLPSNLKLSQILWFSKILLSALGNTETYINDQMVFLAIACGVRCVHHLMNVLEQLLFLCSKTEKLK